MLPMKWARITKAGTDTKKFAVQQMEYLGKVADGLIVFPYGIHGNVPPDALALMFAVQNNPDNRAAIAWTPNDRPVLKEGEVAFYHPPTDALIKWDQDGNLEVTTGNGSTGNIVINCAKATINASTDTTINTPLTTVNSSTSIFTGDVIINKSLSVNDTDASGSSFSGGIAFTGAMTSDGKNVRSTHGHSQANDSDGDSQQNTNGVI